MENEYTTIIAAIIRKHIDVMGPTVALSIAQKIPTIKVAQNGDVLSLTGDPKTALVQVTQAYASFAGSISDMIVESVLAAHPDISLDE
ncbi:MAG: hypothetical protein AAB581_01845 [Patescibacteria group bacterium]